MHRRACLLMACFFLLASAGLPAAQQVPPPAGPVEATPDSPDAGATRERFVQLLRQVPPTVGDVLRRDPSLMSQPDYMAPYPALAAYLRQHPEIARNPGFFLGSFEYYERQPRDVAIEMFQVVGAGLAILTAGTVLLSVFVWLVRAVIDHRRWLRLSRVQAEVHTKVMDRLTSSEELMAYVQSPAGRRFLESAPIEIGGSPRRHSAPVTSILWSLQGGVVLLSLGVGMWFLQGRVMPEVAEGFFVIGVIAAALGAGFIGSSLTAYLLSTRLGLVARPGIDRA